MKIRLQSRNSAAYMPRAVGIAGIEKRLADNHQRTHESISQVGLFQLVYSSMIFAVMSFRESVGSLCSSGIPFSYLLIVLYMPEMF